MDPAALPARSLSRSLCGRGFVHPVFDLLVIGGGLSLVAMAIIAATGRFAPAGFRFAGFGLPSQAALILAFNSAHFAASSVRLYTKPGSFEQLPLTTMAFPLIALALTALAIADAGRFASAVQALYLTWSPYHYGAQAYGLALIFAYRSGCAISPREKRWLRATCLLPFLLMFLGAPGFGLAFLLPQAWLADAGFASARAALLRALALVMLVLPFLLYAAYWLRQGRPAPLISLSSVLANGVWFALVGYRDAVVWATIFHGLQYLAIALIFHVRDQVARPQNHRSALQHGLRFYGASFALGYALFHLLPQAFAFAGFGMVESMLTVIAAINLHHFVVDAFIWRLGSRDGNRAIVERGALAVA